MYSRCKQRQPDETESSTNFQSQGVSGQGRQRGPWRNTKRARGFSRKGTRLTRFSTSRGVAILGPADFFGAGCLAGQPLRTANAAAMSECSIMRLEKQGVIRMLHSEPTFSELFLHYLLSRNIRIEEDLVDDRKSTRL